MCTPGVPYTVLSRLRHMVICTPRLANGAPECEGKYGVTVGDVEFEFTDARLAPPEGAVARSVNRCTIQSHGLLVY